MALTPLDERRMGQRTLDIYTEVLARAPFSRWLRNDGERCAALSLSVPDVSDVFSGSGSPSKA